VNYLAVEHDQEGHRHEGAQQHGQVRGEGDLQRDRQGGEERLCQQRVTAQ
jgi:hypothetical protein